MRVSFEKFFTISSVKKNFRFYIAVLSPSSRCLTGYLVLLSTLEVQMVSVLLFTLSPVDVLRDVLSALRSWLHFIKAKAKRVLKFVTILFGLLAPTCSLSPIWQCANLRQSLTVWELVICACICLFLGKFQGFFFHCHLPDVGFIWKGRKKKSLKYGFM